MGIFGFLKKGRTFQDGTFVKPFKDREKKAARARFEKLDRLADKALRPFLGSFNVEPPRKLKQLKKKLSRLDLRKLLAIRETAQTHFKSQATWQLVQQSINARVDAIDDPEELKQLNRFYDQLFNGQVTQLRTRARLSRLQ